MYKVFNGTDWINFETYLMLINWISQWNVRSFNKIGKSNKFLDRIGHSDKDTCRHTKYTRTGEYLFLDGTTYPKYHVDVEYKVRDCRVTNEDGISIYDRKFIMDVLNHTFDRKLNDSWVYNRNKNKKHVLYRCGWLMIRDSDYPEFRRGPVPFVHKSGHYSFYRRIATSRERRMTCNKEAEPFNRASRAYNLPTSWDDIARDWRDSGWKSQGKHRHQWEHGVIEETKHKHGKHTHTIKNVNKKHIDPEWLEVDTVDEEDYIEN